MIKELVHDEAALSVPAEPATIDDVPVAQDLYDTIDSMRDRAAMLAANQIGSNKAIIAYQGTDDRLHAMFNPRLKLGMRAQKLYEECLSLEGQRQAKRFDTITVEYEELVDGALVTKKRKFTGFTAQAIQHGIDHCKGIVI